MYLGKMGTSSHFLSAFTIFVKFLPHKNHMDITILGIESSCDDTSAAVIRDRTLLSNVIASQAVHQKYGGVIPELASRAHQQNIVPVVDTALKEAGVTIDKIDAIAFTRGPGLLGSLLVGVSFAKGLSISHDIPLVEVNHLQGHILSHFLDLPDRQLPHPDFPFLCLLVSGGHTQIVKVDGPLDMQIVGTTIDDAAGEAFDKCAKVMGLPYPGGPVIDKLAKEGDPHAFRFAKPRIEGFDYSFSGLKTSFLYTLRDEMAEDPNFIEKNKADLCASLQTTIVEILLDKLVKASKEYGIRDIAIAGGVSANSGLRNGITEEGRKRGWRTFLPEFKFTTDNAAMIALAGYYRERQYRNPGHRTRGTARGARTDRRTDSGTITEIQTVPTLHTIFLRTPGIQNLQKAPLSPHRAAFRENLKPIETSAQGEPYEKAESTNDTTRSAGTTYGEKGKI